MLWQNQNLPDETWQDFVRRHPVSPSVIGVVLEVHGFGAFLRVPDGVVGILHCSVWQREPVPGERLSVRVTNVDSERRLLSFAPA